MFDPFPYPFNYIQIYDHFTSSKFEIGLFGPNGVVALVNNQILSLDKHCMKKCWSKNKFLVQKKGPVSGFVGRIPHPSLESRINRNP